MKIEYLWNSVDFILFVACISGGGTMPINTSLFIFTKHDRLMKNRDFVMPHLIRHP